jgi:hypothetical protein
VFWSKSSAHNSGTLLLFLHGIQTSEEYIKVGRKPYEKEFTSQFVGTILQRVQQKFHITHHNDTGYHTATGKPELLHFYCYFNFVSTYSLMTITH